MHTDVKEESKSKTKSTHDTGNTGMGPCIKLGKKIASMKETRTTATFSM